MPLAEGYPAWILGAASARNDVHYVLETLPIQTRVDGVLRATLGAWHHPAITQEDT
jgi:hypothetical protein